MEGEGWIKLFRQIKDSWIWDDPIKLRWWIDILLTVNHSDAKVNIGFELYECNRGQSILSLRSWGQRWKVSKDTVRNFFVLLEKDKMIQSESLKKSTRITVCNYDTYQGGLHEEKTVSRQLADNEHTQAHPNNKKKNNKKEKEELLQVKDTYIPSQDFGKFQEWMKSYTPTVLKMKTQMTEENLTSLKLNYDSTLIAEKLTEMENKADLLKKYTSVYLTLRKWLKPKS
jgi:hypothetical protein